MQSTQCIVTADKIITMTPDGDVESVAISAGRIVLAGSRRDLRRLAGARTIEYGFPGATITPGLIDAHLHTVGFGISLGQVAIGPQDAPDIPTIAGLLAERASVTPAGHWVLGRGYDQNRLTEHRHPTCWELDQAVPDHPVLVTHTSGHMAVANSRALAIADIGRDTDAPSGGAIVRDANGLPTGLLQETAQRLVLAKLPPADAAQVRQALRLAHRRFAIEGLTGVHEAGCPAVHPEEVNLYQQAVADRELTARTYLMIYPRSLGESLQLGLGLRTLAGEGMLTLGPLKLMADGSLIGLTAMMDQPFASQTDDTGLWVTDPGQLQEWVLQGHRRGWQLATHAIGDKAIRLVLDLYERAQLAWPRSDARHRIEHCGVLTAELIARLAATGTIPVTQPRFISELGDGFRRALGPERLSLTYPLRSLLAAGIKVAAGSDRPVVSGAPLLGIHDAVNQVTASGNPYVPTEAVTFRQALAMYTVNAAYAAHQETLTGCLGLGMAADLTVLGGDPDRDPSGIAALPILGTMVGGRWTHLA